VARTVLRGLLGRKLDSRSISTLARSSDRVAYDENKYLAALAKRGSTLSSVLKSSSYSDNLVKFIVDPKSA
jgi:hypothetical protein